MSSSVAGGATRHLIFHQFDPLHHVAGGIPGFILELIQFAQAGHEFTVVGIDSSDRHRLGVWEDQLIGNRKIRFMPVARFDIGNQQRKIPHSVRFLSGILRYRPDITDCVLHTHRVEIGVALSFLLPSHPRVQFIHGDGVEALRHKSETFWRWLPTAYERIEIAAVRRADRTIVMSEAAAARLARHSPTVEFGSNWFDETLFYPNGAGRQGSQLRIAWFGRLEPPKDPLLAIAVLEQLAARGISFSAWFAGTGSLVNMVENAIAQAGLREQVRLLGLLSRAELAAELRNSSVCLMTSLWEGFPRSAVEALACGVPIVSTDVGEMRALLAPATNGFVAATREPEELAERLVAADALDDAERIAASVGHLEATTKVGDLLESLRPLAASAARAP